MFKKFLTFSVFALTMCTMVQAQKERMYVRAFTYGSSVSAENCEKVRAAVFGAVNASERFELLDAFAQAGIAQELEKIKGEDAMHDPGARNNVAVVKANSYIMDGDVSALEVKEDIKDGKKVYACSFNFSVTITDIFNNTTVATKNFSHSSSSVGGTLGSFLNYDSPEKAINGSLSTIEKDIKNFIIDEFPLEGTIYGEDFEIKKDKLTQCYINLGSNIGVKEGDIFNIFEIKIKVGKATKSEIGRMKIIQADEEVALGKVTKGGKEVKLAMDRFLENKAADEANAKPLVVISAKKENILDKGLNLLE